MLTSSPRLVDPDTAVAISGNVVSGTVGSVLFVGTGSVLSQDNASLFFDDTNNRLGLLTSAPTHTLTLSSSNTGITSYNTVDQTTNYERYIEKWVSNAFEMGNFYGGSGNSRNVRIGSTQTAGASSLGTYIEVSASGGSPFFNFIRSSGGSVYPFISTSGINPIASSGTQTTISVSPNIQQTSTASYIALDINPTETSTGSGTKLLQRWAVGGTQKVAIDNTGHIFFDATITAGGTTGNQTINKPSGTVNFAAAATALTVTNSTVSASSIVLCVLRTNDTTARIANVVPGSGTFTINLTAAATAETSCGFVVIN